MTSQTPPPSRRRTKKQAPAQWQAGTSCDVLPTLVVLLTDNDKEAKALEEDLKERLWPIVAIGALQWLTQSKIDPNEPISSVVQACESLLALHLWQRLVDEGYQSRLPDHRHRAHIRVVVLWDQPSSAGGSLDLLAQILEVKRQLESRAEVLPVLIWLGKPPADLPDSLLGYWPRIRLETIALGGTQVEPWRLYEVSQHILVSLIATELTRAIEYIRQGLDKEPAWLVLGASALVANPHQTQRWLYQVMPKWALEGLVAAPLTDAQRLRIEKVVERQVDGFRRAMLKEATESLKEAEPGKGKWQADLDEEHLAVRCCVLEDQDMRRAIFGPCLVGPLASLWRDDFPLKKIPLLLSALSRPFRPERDLELLLRNHYNEIFDRLQFWLSADGSRGLASQVVEQTKSLKGFLGAFLDRGLVPAEGLPILQGQEALPAGLEAAIYALMTATERLAVEGDLAIQQDGEKEQIRVAALGADNKRYLQAVARGDADIIRGYRQRYERFARTLASPLGVALYLLPAWPLATYLLNLLPDSSLGRCMLVAGISLLLIGALDLAYWWLIRARRLLGEIQQRIYNLLVHRVLGLMALTIRDYRLWALRWLRDSGYLLMDLYTTLLEKYQEAVEAWQSIEVTKSRAEGGLYRLAAPWKISEWAKAAAKNVHDSALLPKPKNEDQDKIKYDSAVTAFLASEFWPFADPPTPVQMVWYRLNDVCVQEANRLIERDQEFLKASMLAEEVEALREGKRWDWLAKQAQPLGMVDQPASPFTIVLAPENYLGGNTGRNSHYWQDDWVTAYTRQEYEEICIRGVIELR